MPGTTFDPTSDLILSLDRFLHHCRVFPYIGRTSYGLFGYFDPTP